MVIEMVGEGEGWERERDWRRERERGRYSNIRKRVSAGRKRMRLREEGLERLSDRELGADGEREWEKEMGRGGIVKGSVGRLDREGERESETERERREKEKGVWDN